MWKKKKKKQDGGTAGSCEERRRKKVTRNGDGRAERGEKWKRQLKSEIVPKKMKRHKKNVMKKKQKQMPVRGWRTREWMCAGRGCARGWSADSAPAARSECDGSEAWRRVGLEGNW